MRKNSSLSPPKAVLFDWDNTLVKTWPVIAFCMNETLARMGHDPWTDQEVQERIGGSLRDTFPVLFGDRWQEASDTYQAAFENIHLEKLGALEHAVAALQAVRSAGVYCALVSNKTGAHLRTEVDHLGWQDYFGAVIGATDAAKDKPAPDPVHMALAGSDVSTGPQVWFVGDTPTDTQCALNAGCTAILIHKDLPKADRYGDAMPHAHVSRLDLWIQLFQDMT